MSARVTRGHSNARGRFAAILLAFISSVVPDVTAARPLEQGVPGLFGGSLFTTVRRFGVDPTLVESQRLRFASQFQGLSAALAAARSQAPIPSASGAFRFAWDPELDTFVRSTQSLGSAFAERAQTLGQHTGTLSVSYTRVSFDTLEGDPLNRLSFSQSAFSDDILMRLSPSDQALFGDDLIASQLDLSLSFNLFFLTAAYGITDDIDVSLALSMNEAHLRSTVVSQIQKPVGRRGRAFFLDESNRLSATSGTLCGFPTQPNARCATDSFDDSAFGTGDLFLRAKWHFADTRLADLAVAGGLTLPTGNADDFLGFHDPTFTPWLIGSKTIGRVSPHVNLGYAFRSGADVSQAQWIAGADVLVTNWLTLATDFLGYHDDKRDGINDNIFQSAVGFKVNPFGKLVLGGSFQFPLNREGIRADVIYTGQIEYTF
jgi:hypothetical protein